MTSIEITKCPACGLEGAQKYRPNGLDTEYVCGFCGQFMLTQIPEGQLNAMPERDKAMIVAWLHERKMLMTERIPLLHHARGNDSPAKYSVVTPEDILDVMRSVFNSPRERADRALRSLQRSSSELGEMVVVQHPAQVYGGSQREAIFILEALQADEMIQAKMSSEGMGHRAKLTITGWDRIAELERQKHGIDSTQAFVAMWFDDSLKSAYESGIKAAVVDAGYNPLRIDARLTLGKICDEIIAEIRKSRFMVADLTGQRHGVYFEAGFALGLGIPVIWTVHKDKLEELKQDFDTRQYRYTAWDDPEDLRRQLKARIEANIPKAPAKR